MFTNKQYSAKAFQVLIFPSEVHQLLITDLKHKIKKIYWIKVQPEKKLSDTSNTAVSFTKQESVTSLEGSKCVYFMDFLKSLKEKQSCSRPLVFQHTHSDKREYLANTL